MCIFDKQIELLNINVVKSWAIFKSKLLSSILQYIEIF